MKTNLIFERLARVVLIAALACNLLAIPNRDVSAKPLALPYNCATQSEIPTAECEALVILYNSTDGNNWFDKTGWLQTSTPCSWFGVACEDGTNVTSISMFENNLSGPLPPQLANLTQLTTLELAKNSSWPNGAIPPELGSLTQLTTLDLRSYGFSGPIPPELGNLINLSTLMLGGYGLTGPIPPELGNLASLTTLRLTETGLSGPIPPELGSLANLTSLYLDNTELSGPISLELGNLVQLQVLSLSGSGLAGSIPPELGNLAQLSYLDLSNNALSGLIPTTLGGLEQLRYLYLNDNMLSGSIPAELSNLAQLEYLVLTGNSLSGPIPSELGSLGNLRALDVDSNRLSGEFPVTISNLAELTRFTFDCELTSFDPDVVAFIDDVTPGWQDDTCPAVTSPLENAILDNGRTDLLDDIVWDFDWSDVPGATNYQLYVERASAPTPEIDLSSVADSSYHHVRLNSHIAAPNLAGWQWKVRAYINDQWGEWSETRPFSVELPNLDAPQALAKNGGLNTYTGPSRIPTFWKAVNFAATDGKSTSVKQEGVASVKLSGPVGKLKTLSQTLKISGPAGDLFIFSYRVKGSALPAGGVCHGRVSFYSGATLKGIKTLQCPTITNYSFKKMTIKFPAPAAYNKVVITFTYNKPSGTVWFDAVSLIR